VAVEALRKWGSCDEALRKNGEALRKYDEALRKWGSCEIIPKKVYVKNVNIIYSGHALSYTSTKG